MFFWIMVILATVLLAVGFVFFPSAVLLAKAGALVWVLFGVTILTGRA